MTRLLLLLVAVSASARAQFPEYTLTFSDTNVRRIHVVARLPLANDTLRMSGAMVSELPDGWATFVHDLTGSDGARRLQLDPLPGGRWVIRGARPRRITLTYTVLVSHDSVRWNVSGAWARAYAAAGSVFFTGRAVFIAAVGQDTLSARIRVKLPAGWSFATPYHHVKGDAAYDAASLSDLWSNGSLAGPLALDSMKVGELQMQFAGAMPMRAAVSLFANTLRPVAEVFASMMGGSPSGKLVALGNFSPDFYSNWGGEAFRQSISTVMPTEPNLTTRITWSYTLAHELFHLWNPMALPPARQAEFEWVVEGFTDYMTRLALFRAGINTEQEFLDATAATVGRYRSVGGKLSLVTASGDKGPNYTLIYFGGSTVAAALDVELRRRTNGVTGVPQLVARLYANHRRTAQPYSMSGLIALVSEMAGADMSSFFSSYVTGIELVPIESYFREIGLGVTARGTTVSIHKVPDATEAQRRLLTAVLSR